MKISTTHILLPAFNFNGQSLKLPDECGPTISDHTKQHCHNKRSMITPEAWTPRWLLIVNALQLNELSVLRNTFYPEYKYEFHTVYWTARDEKNTEKIISVKYSTYAVVKRKPEKVPTLSVFKAQFGFLAQLIRALHQYRRGQGSSPGKAEFFPGFLFAVA